MSHLAVVRIGCLALALVLAQADARAQAMDDPMRPPNSAATGGAAATGAPAASGLQGVLTSPGRKLAVIDGAVVPLGAAVRDAKLAGVSDSLAVLKKNGERDVLFMHPGIDKKPSQRREAP